MPETLPWALTRGYALHPGTRNRYEIRYTRTQHRPASRRVNDRGRVSGTHRVLTDTAGELVVEVESTVRRLRCPRCGFKCHRVHDRRAKKVRDLEVSGRPVTLVWQRRRMVCGHCDSRFLEDHPVFEGALTARLARRIVADAKVMTFRAAARRHGVHWHAVRALVDTWSALVAERRRSRRCRVLLVDETSIRKRHRYVTVIVNGDTGKTLAMVPNRSSAALSAFFVQQGRPWCKQVKVVVTDGSRAYKAAIDAPWVPETRPWSLTCRDAGRYRVLVYRISYRFLASLARLTVRSRRSKDLEIIVLRHQLGVLRRQVDRPELTDADRSLLGAIAAALARPSRAGWLVTPRHDLQHTNPTPHLT